MLTTFPQCDVSMEFPAILSQNYICYHWLSVYGISKIMHCGILNNMPYYLPPALSCESSSVDISSAVVLGGGLTRFCSNDVVDEYKLRARSSSSLLRLRWNGGSGLIWKIILKFVIPLTATQLYFYKYKLHEATHASRKTVSELKQVIFQQLQQVILGR